MAIDFKKPSEIAEEFLTHLKGLKPEVNTKQTDSDWYIRAHVVGGVFSGIYADQRKISDDAFPQSSREEATERHLETYFERGFNEAETAVGNVKVTGVSGSTAAIGAIELLYEPNGNTYKNTESVTLLGPSGIVAVESIVGGQDQNLLEGAELTISSPPAGFAATAEVYGGPLADGKNAETNEEAQAAILARIREPIAGGKTSDYEQWAREADASVNDVSIIRFFAGIGTVGIAFTAGTRDFDEALDEGEAIVLEPSDALLETVNDYIDSLNPTTDCIVTLKGFLLSVNVTAHVRYQSGSGSTVPTGQTLTQQQLVEREIKRAIYNTPLGGRRLVQNSSSGWVVASEIEEVIDSSLSATPYTIGSYAQILVDRQVDDLSATGANLLIAGYQKAVPGTITIVEMT